MSYIERDIDKDLEDWAISKSRKPLLLRGARQVGKSSSVRKLGEKFEHYLEINFEKEKNVRELFETADSLHPPTLCSKLSLIKDMPVVPGKTLLFFDEIQRCLPAISSLRFFYEDYPALHVVAAGSLLEFALEELPSLENKKLGGRVFHYSLFTIYSVISLFSSSIANPTHSASGYAFA